MNYPKVRLAVDLLGSDTSAQEFLDAVVEFCVEAGDAAECYVLVTQDAITETRFPENLIFIPVSETILPEDDPLHAIRQKRGSSLVVGMQLLRDGKVDAIISAGNTGALMAAATLFVGLLPSIERPALLTLVPTQSGNSAVLDVGANVQCKAEHLVQFALMGIAYQKCRGISQPKIGLLNIGTEEKKGTPELKLAYQKLQTLIKDNKADSCIFLGNIEARDVFQGLTDVLVTDGFTGNVFLKTSEGLAIFLLEQLRSISERLDSPPLKALTSQMEQRLHYSEHPGAILCGINGLVMKIHGQSTHSSLLKSLKALLRLVQGNYISLMRNELQSL